jgi:small subunit ribosomal protein S9
VATKKSEKQNVNLGLGTGRRKTAVARVYLRDGEGKITINGRNVDEYFGNPLYVYMVKQPLDVTDNMNKFDLVINVNGGGPTGQAGACRHGIARALVAHDEANRPVLHANGFMTRDSRMVERKKFGQPGARRKFQFSKR